MSDFEPPIRGVEGLPRSIEPPRDLWPGVHRRIHWRRRLGLGGVGLAAAAALVFVLLPRVPLVPTTVVAGHPNISRARVVTDGTSRARLTLSIGDVLVEPRTDLRVLTIKPGEQRFELRQGT
ncbi:MAG TPA: hypothetical protein VJS20_07430, partial [Gemmatimonadales bacterium]|nr:hypothetical protein [Gemmatimonadales bacterium]